MSRLIIDIKNESTKEKILWMLEHFKDDGVEIQSNSETKAKLLSDEFIEKNYKKIVSKSLENYDPNYRKSFKYKVDRADFIEMKGQV